MLPEHLQKWAEPTKVLDFGSITLLDVMGDNADAAILQAARTSTGSGRGQHKWVAPTPTGRANFTKVCKACGVGMSVDTLDIADRNLLRYLLRNHHATPFEACTFKVHVKLPIFVERQWCRHRASGHNEASARYQQLPAEWYIPSPERVQAQSTDNRQGSGGALDSTAVDDFRRGLDTGCREAYQRYQYALDTGVTRELARLELHVNHYTEKVWWVNLRMLLHLLALRKHPHAQWEIQEYAKAMWLMVQDWAPWTAEAFDDYTLGAHTFSRQEMAALRNIVQGGERGWIKSRQRKRIADTHDLGTVRERKAFWKKLRLLD